MSPARQRSVAETAGVVCYNRSMHTPHVRTLRMELSDGRLVSGSVVAACLLLLVCATPAPSAPEQPVRMIAEWEPAWGALVRWPLNIPVELVREISEDDTVYTLVEGTGNQNQAQSTFESAGVVMDHVRFIQTDVYSSWTRDWGPQCVFDGTGQMGMTDPWFDGYPWVPGCEGGGGAGPVSLGSGGATGVARVSAPAVVSVATHRDVYGSANVHGGPARARGYEDDDVIPGDVAACLGVPHHLMPAYCTGGNIMTDGHGRAFSTQQMLDENAPYMSEAAFRSIAESYLGISDYSILPNPEVYGIQHVDCYAKLLDEETVLVKEVPTWHPEHGCVEDLVDAFAALETCHGRPYRIVRVWCEPYSGDEVAAYTNSLILNGKVLVPTFGMASDADALSTYADAMPGYEVIGIDYGGWLYYDALHCRTMGIFDAGMLRLSHARLQGVLPASPSQEIEVMIEPMSGEGLVPGEQVVRWRLEGESAWSEETLTASRPGPARGGVFVGHIPGQAPGDVVEYYVAAADSSGRSETLPRTAPDGYYSFEVDPSSGVDGGTSDDAGSALAMAVGPTPFASCTAISYNLPAASRVRLCIYDVSGRRVAMLVDREQAPGPHEVLWDGAAGPRGRTSGRRVPSGVYLARLEAAGETAARKLVLLR